MKISDNTVLLTTAYFPNTHYFTKLIYHKQILVEVNETFQKQSYRNRCSIYGANGKQDLIVPVVKPNGNKTITKDILVDYSSKWQQDHWRAIKSAYGHSPFFEVFEPEFIHLYEHKEKFLIDFNALVLNQVFSSIDLTLSYTYSDKFLNTDNYLFDYRDSIHPKARMQQPDPYFKPSKYYQVFQLKHDFIPNLSILDLLMNEGALTKTICLNSIVQAVE